MTRNYGSRTECESDKPGYCKKKKLTEEKSLGRRKMRGSISMLMPASVPPSAYVQRCLEWLLPDANDIFVDVCVDLVLHLSFYSSLHKIFKILHFSKDANMTRR